MNISGDFLRELIKINNNDKDIIAYNLGNLILSTIEKECTMEDIESIVLNIKILKNNNSLF